jgi:hypothetical protein
MNPSMAGGVVGVPVLAVNERGDAWRRHTTSVHPAKAWGPAQGAQGAQVKTYFKFFEKTRERV